MTALPPAPERARGEQGRATSSPDSRTRALPVVAVLVVVGLIAALLVPAVRHQLSVSFQRQPQRYLELYFENPATAQACVAGSGVLVVTADVRSHLAANTTLAWKVQVTSAGKTVRTVSGSVPTRPGAVSRIRSEVGVPRNAPFDVALSLPGHNEHLSLHCGGAT